MTATRASADPRGRTCIHRPDRRFGERAGLSLVEVSIAVILLTIALCGITGSIVASDELHNANRETAMAEAGARSMIETLHGISFPTVFARYNSVTYDDPLAVTSPGANFAVRGLQAVPGDPDGLAGEIIFPTALVGGVLQLRENVPFTALGMPRDLNGSGGVPDGLDHATDYRILPVRVRIRWSGANGVRTLDTETVLCAR